MKCPLLAIVRRHTEWGPDAAGATSVSLLPRRPRRGQAAAPLAFSGSVRSAVETGASRSASREGRGNRPCDAFGNLPPRQGAKPGRAWPEGCVERVRKETKCPPKIALSNGSRQVRRSSATEGWARCCPPP